MLHCDANCTCLPALLFTNVEAPPSIAKVTSPDSATRKHEHPHGRDLKLNEDGASRGRDFLGKCDVRASTVDLHQCQEPFKKKKKDKEEKQKKKKKQKMIKKRKKFKKCKS